MSLPTNDDPFTVLVTGEVGKQCLAADRTSAGFDPLYVVFWKSSSSHKAWPVGLLKSRSTTGYGIASPFGAVLSGLGASMAFGLT